jgi:hypothetical protein
MRRLYSERKSGILNVSASGAKRRLYFRKGAAVFLDGGEGAERPTREKAEAGLLSMFSWISGQFSFEERDPTIDETQAFQKQPAQLILEGTRPIHDPRVLETFLGARGTIFSKAQTPELPLFTVKLTPVESAILKLARGRERFTAADLADISNEASLSNALNVLVSLGLLEIVQKVEAPRPAPEPVKAPAPVAAPKPPVKAPAPAATAPAPQPPVAAPPRPVAAAAPRPATPAAPPAPAPSPPAAPPPRAAAPAPPARPVVAPKPGPRPKQAAPPVPADGAARTETPSSLPADRAAARGSASRAAPPAPGSRSGRWRWIAVGSIAIAGTAAALALWLYRGAGDTTEPAALAAPSPEELSLPEVPDVPEAPAGPEALSPSELDLLSRAKIALQAGDLEGAKTELTELLRVRPELAEAQELMAGVERELSLPGSSPSPEPTEAPPPPRRRVEKAPEPKAVDQSLPAEPSRPDPARLFDEARAAFARGDLDLTSTRLEQILIVDPNFPGAWKLQEDVADKKWEQSLPHKYGARHAHRLGGCVGVVLLASGGISYASNEHQWTWAFADLVRAIRKDDRHLSLETRDGKSFNFELGESLSALEWTRFLELAK